ncbi:hypothetical protein A4A49_13768 [Nicotiana attenuata]|uniref:Uncharacterized protein n=1 Tax=Nicotiana attenuata TaxID=49451 RepID=A0A1J6ISE4_NICAT|nr:hypothetical protein A4A49_13768 [Nicotiana attenuata]
MNSVVTASTKVANEFGSEITMTTKTRIRIRRLEPHQRSSHNPNTKQFRIQVNSMHLKPKNRNRSQGEEAETSLFLDYKSAGFWVVSMEKKVQKCCVFTRVFERSSQNQPEKLLSVVFLLKQNDVGKGVSRSKTSASQLS